MEHKNVLPLEDEKVEREFLLISGTSSLQDSFPHWKGSYFLLELSPLFFHFQTCCPPCGIYSGFNYQLFAEQLQISYRKASLTWAEHVKSSPAGSVSRRSRTGCRSRKCCNVLSEYSQLQQIKNQYPKSREPQWICSAEWIIFPKTQNDTYPTQTPLNVECPALRCEPVTACTCAA